MAGSSEQEASARLNPYVGPRPFEPGEQLLGRDREINDLYYQLSAERIVLLHSPSGAGKSSLINAGLLPRLRDRFDVWHPTRVNLPLPEALTGHANRYALSAMLGIEQGIPEERRRSPATLAGMTLLEHARSLPRPDGALESVLVIFDQFEEVLTLDPVGIAGKKEFFLQLGELLRDPGYWALFAMREDFLAPLDPYTDFLPTHLRNRMRLDLLSRQEQAPAAIAVPALTAGRPFQPEAVEKLVADLALVRVQQSDGSFQDQPGLYIEPLQLQVVCRRLWEQLPEATVSIGIDDIQQFGDVDDALAGYYAAAVRRICGGDRRCERTMREWVNFRLITPGGSRGQVQREVGSSGGLSNRQIEELVKKHLVRAEQRAGATWYELAHDRLIDPLRTDNAAWLDLNMLLVQKTARLWAEQGRPDSLLFAGKDLEEARRNLDEMPGELTGNEHAFIQASLEADARRLAAERELIEDARQARRNRILAILSTASLALALIATSFALTLDVEMKRSRDDANEQTRLATRLKWKARWEKWLADGQRLVSDENANQASAAREVAQQETTGAQHETIRAEQQTKLALAGQLLARAKLQVAQNPSLLPLSTLLAMEANDRNPSSEARTFLRTSLKLLRHTVAPPLRVQSVGEGTVFSRTARLAAFRHQGNVDVIEVSTGKLLFSKPSRWAFLAFSQDEQLIAMLSADDGLKVFETAGGTQRAQMYGATTISKRAHLAFSNDSRYLAASTDRGVEVWQLGRPGKPVFTQPILLSDWFSPLLFPNNSNTFVMAHAESIKVLELGSWKELRSIPIQRSAEDAKYVPAIVGSPDGKLAAVGNHLYALPGWTLLSTFDPAVQEGSAFSADDSFLALYSPAELQLLAAPDWRHLSAIRLDVDFFALAFSPLSGYLATASVDGTARIWHLPSQRDRAVGFVASQPVETARMSHDEEVEAVAWNPTGDRLVTSSGNFLQTWQVRGNEGEVKSYKRDLAMFNKLGAFNGPVVSSDQVLFSRLSTDGSTLVSERRIGLEVTRTGLLQDKLVGTIAIRPDRQVGNFDVSGDGRFVAVATTPRDPFAVRSPQGSLSMVLLTPNSAIPGLTIQIWRVDGMQQIAEFPATYTPTILTFSPGARFLLLEHLPAANSRTPFSTDFDIRDLRLNTWPLKNIHTELPVRFSSSERYLAADDLRANLHLWDTQSWKELPSPTSNEQVRDLFFSEKDALVILAQPAGTEQKFATSAPDVMVWRPGVPGVEKIKRGGGQEAAIAISPGGTLVATAEAPAESPLAPNTVMLWKPGGPVRVAIDQPAVSLSFSADGRYLAVTGRQSLMVVDVDSARQEAYLDTDITMRSAVFSPNPKVLFATDYAGGGLLWSWPGAGFRAMLCHALTVNLSPEAWSRYLPGERYHATCPLLPPGTGNSYGFPPVPPPGTLAAEKKP